MRTGSSVKVLGFCGFGGWGGWGGGPAVIWGCWEHEEAGTWWVRVSSGANQVFTPAAGNKIRRYGVKRMWKITMVAGKNGGSDGKESACSAGDLGSIPGLGRSLGEENGNPLQ